MSWLGIDVGDSSIKIVEIDKKGPAFVLINWGITDIPENIRTRHPEREIFQAEVIKKFAIHTSSKEAVVVVGGLEIVSKIISLPPLKEDEINDAVKWQMKDEIPFKVEEGIFNFVKLGSKDKKKTDYLVVVAKQDLILRALQTVGLAGIKPLSIIPSSEALFYTFQKEIAQEGVVCLLNMGRFLTNISFYENGVLQLSRDVPIGSDDITRAMTSILVSEEGRLELNYEEAEKIRVDYGIPLDLEKFPKLEHIPISHLQAVVRPALERIEEEVIRTIEYYRNKISENKISKIIFTGSASQTPNLAEVLSNAIGIGCEIVDPFSRITIRDDIDNKPVLIKSKLRLSGAAGAVLALNSKVNLIPEEYRNRAKVLLKKFLTPYFVGGLIGFVLLIFLGVLFANVYILEEKKVDLANQVAVLEPKVSQLKALVRSAGEEAGRKDVFASILSERLNVSQILENLSKTVPSAVLLDEINFEPSGETVSVVGLAFEKDHAAEKSLSQFIANLSSSSIFSEVELRQAGLGNDYLPKNFKFEIGMGIKRK